MPRQAGAIWLGDFGWSVPRRPSSVIEPGVTPSQDLVLGPWNTFTEFEQACSQSVVLGGVHFTAAIVEGQKLCRPIGDLAFDFVDGHIRGQVH